jgi:hypothetical protein
VKRPVVVLLASHPVSLAGTVLVTTAGLLWCFALPAQTRGHVDNPYAGIILFLILPLVFFLGLALIPLGIFLAKRRVASSLSDPAVDRASAVRRLAVFVGVTTLANVVIGSQLSYRAVEHMETTQFCGQSCHVMKPEFSAHAVAPHSKIACVSCHVAPGATGWLHSKLNGTRQLIEVVADSFPRPIPAGLASGRLVPSEHSCESCHAREAGRAIRVKVIPKRADDEGSSASWTVLAMKTQAIHRAHMGDGFSIRFAATDASRQSIPWVEVARRPPAAGVTYFGTGATPESTAALPRYTMQCVDCHNRAAHTFERPALAIARAMTFGEIPSLPYINKKGLELLQASYADEADARARIASDLKTYYTRSHADIAASRSADIDRTGSAIFAIWSRNVFPDLKVTWGTYPSNMGHEQTPGCFRCHDGEHATADGAASITPDCATCHEAIAVEEASPEILKTLGISPS